MTDIVPAKKYECEGLAFEVEVLTPMDPKDILDPERIELANAIADVDAQIDICQAEVQKLDAEIDRLTNHADGLDYAVAVASGVLSGLIDSFLVGETDFKATLKDNGDKDRHGAMSVDRLAQNQPPLEPQEESDNSEKDLESMISCGLRFLSGKPLTDESGVTEDSGANQSELDILAHQPSLKGMVASLVLHYCRAKPYAHKDDSDSSDKEDDSKFTDFWLPLIVASLFDWLISMAENPTDTDKLPAPIAKLTNSLSKSQPVIAVMKGISIWCFHKCCAYAYSKKNNNKKSSNAEKQDTPSLLLTVLDELCKVPPLNETNLSTTVENLYAKKHIDAKTELEIAKLLGKQSVPVLINEALVRTFYFVRRFISEYNKTDSLAGIDWQQVIPFNNRTIARMLTIATGTFVAVDAADAAIRSGGFNAACLLRINFVGIGRFAVALGTDIGMGIKRNRLLNERIHVMSQQLALYNAKVYYKCAQIHYAEMDMLEAETDMWLEAADTETALQNTYELAEASVVYVSGAIAQINSNLAQISTYRDDIEKLNPGLNKRLVRILKY